MKSIKNKTKQNIASIAYLTLIGFVTFVSGERMAFATFSLGITFLIIFYQKKRVIFLSFGDGTKLFGWIVSLRKYNDY